VSDIVKGVLGGAWGLVVGWFLPTGLTLGVFGILVLPSLKGLPLLDVVASASAAGRTVALLVAAVVLGFVLSVAQTPLYQVLEGYQGWPKRLREARRRHHVHRRKLLEDEVRAESESAGGAGALSVTGATALQRYLRYPASDDQVPPTLLGSSIRRFEYYAQDRYQLDSQLLWYQLRSVVPDSLSKEVDNARAGADFFVCLCYLSALLAVVSAGTAAVHPEALGQLLLTALIGAASAVGCYRGAVLATDSWAAAVRAMVDLGRVPLAKSYGLVLPATLQDERDMWQTLGWLVAFPYADDAAKAIGRWRAKPDPTPPASDADPPGPESGSG
jgi:hypothetical protein